MRRFSNMAPKRMQTCSQTTSNKKLKIEPLEIDEAPAVEKGVNERDPLKITDLNMDCLEHIFGYLRDSLDDLFAVATIDDTIADAAKIVFRRTYGENVLIIEKYEAEIDSQTIDGLRLIEFLDIFGSNITKIHIKSEMVNVSWKSICSTLINVDDVTILYWQQTVKITEFNPWFPKMKCLKIIFVYYRLRSKFIATHYPLLEKLTITGQFGSHRDQSTLDNFRQMLQKNPQIKVLNSNAVFGCQILSEISKWCPHIERLSMTVSSTRIPMKPPVAEQIYRNVKFLKLRVCFDSDILYLAQLAELFPNAEVVDLPGDLNLPNSYELATFMVQLKQLKEIRFDGFERRNSVTVNESLQNIGTRWLTTVIKGTNYRFHSILVVKRKSGEVQ